MSRLATKMKDLAVTAMHRDFGIQLDPNELNIASIADTIGERVPLRAHRSGEPRCIYEVHTLVGTQQYRIRLYCTLGPQDDISKLTIDRNSVNNTGGLILYSADATISNISISSLGYNCPELGISEVDDILIDSLVLDGITDLVTVTGHTTSVSAGNTVSLWWMDGVTRTTAIVNGFGIFTAQCPVTQQPSGNLHAYQSISNIDSPTVIHQYTAPPPPPVITAEDDGSGLVELTGTSLIGTTVHITWMAGTGGSITTDSNGDWTMTSNVPQPQGIFSLIATINGKTSTTILYTYVPTPPPPVITHTTMQATSVDVCGTAIPGYTVSLNYEENGNVATTLTGVADSNGDWCIVTVDPEAGVFTATQTDPASIKTSLAANFTYVPGPFMFITGISDTGLERIPTITGTATVGAAIAVAWNTGATTVAITDANEDWIITSPIAQADGTIMVTGIKSGMPFATLPVVYDATPPPPVVTATQENGNGTVDLTGTSDPNNIITITWQTGTVTTVIADANGDWTNTSTDSQSDGNFTLTATDSFSEVSVDLTHPFVATERRIHYEYTGGTTATMTVLQNVAIRVEESNGTITDHPASPTSRTITLPVDATGTHVYSTGAWVQVTGSRIDVTGGDFTELHIHSCEVNSIYQMLPATNVCTLLTFPAAGKPMAAVWQASSCIDIHGNCTVGPIPAPLGDRYNMAQAFKNNVSITTFPSWDTTYISGWHEAFMGCTALTALPDMDMSTDLFYTQVDTFRGCSVLTTVGNIHVNGDFRDTFRETGITTIPSLELTGPTRSLFHSCIALTDITVFITNSCGLHSMFYSCISLVNVANNSGTGIAVGNSSFFNCNTLVNMPTLTLVDGCVTAYMFNYCLSLVNLVKPIGTISNASGMHSFNAMSVMVAYDLDDGCPTAGMYSACDNLLTTVSHNGLLTAPIGMFDSCTSLTTAVQLQTDGSTDCNDCYQNCQSLTGIDGGLTPTSAPPTTANNMFKDCTSLTTTPMVTTRSAALSGTSCDLMYNGCTALTTVIWPSPAISSATGMIGGCTSLVTVPVMPLMAGASVNELCQGSTSLEHGVDVGGINLRNPQYMYSGCTALLDTPNYQVDISYNITNYMFANCAAMVTPPVVSGVWSLPVSMFDGCTAMTSVGDFTISNGSDTTNMFRDCTSLLSVGTITGTIQEGDNMFQACTSLACIKGIATTNPYSTALIFSGAGALVNPNGATQTALQSASGSSYTNPNPCP